MRLLLWEDTYGGCYAEDSEAKASGKLYGGGGGSDTGGIYAALDCVSFTLICYDRTALCAGIHEAAQREAFQKMRDGDREETEMPAAVSEVFLTTEDSQRHISVRGEARSRFLSDLIASVFFLPEAGYENEETVFLIYGENQVRQNRAGENEIGESD